LKQYLFQGSNKCETRLTTPNNAPCATIAWLVGTGSAASATSSSTPVTAASQSPRCNTSDGSFNTGVKRFDYEKAR
jgi:hypothetical protein